jgi:hypothetical protein
MADEYLDILDEKGNNTSQTKLETKFIMMVTGIKLFTFELF